MGNERGVIRNFRTDVDEWSADKLWQILVEYRDKDVKY
jgi:hypothetical protein